MFPSIHGIVSQGGQGGGGDGGAPSFLAITGEGGTTQGSTALTRPVEVAPGDLLILALARFGSAASGVTATITPPSGFAELTGAAHTGTGPISLYAYAKVAGAAEPDTYGVSWANTFNLTTWRATLVAYRNCALADSGALIKSSFNEDPVATPPLDVANNGLLTGIWLTNYRVHDLDDTLSLRATYDNPGTSTHILYVGDEAFPDGGVGVTRSATPIDGNSRGIAIGISLSPAT